MSDGSPAAMDRESNIRPWPDGVERKGAARAFAKVYREAFDADPLAVFCAGEINGLTIVVARGWAAERLQRFVELDLDGEIERPREKEAS